jgi:hypothetical protein
MLNWRRFIWQGGAVLRGDFKADSIQWDPRSSAQQNVAFQEDVSDENGLEFGNYGLVTQHGTGEGHNDMSGINLMMAI